MGYIKNHGCNFFVIFSFSIPIETIFRPILPYNVPLPPRVNLVIVEISCRDLGVQLVIPGHAEDVYKAVCKRFIIVINRGVGLKVAFSRRGEPCIPFREWVFGSVRL